MAIAETTHFPWTRKHDDPRIPFVGSAARIVFPANLDELIEICQKPSDPLKVVGSHWSLSGAAVSDHTFIETHEPTGSRPRIAKMLTNVVPGCLNEDYVRHMHEQSIEQTWYLAHFESGKRVCQLYAELDQPVDINDPETLGGYIKAKYGNDRFAGPWAFHTLGGAGGQTVVGALGTGTHGGDFDRPPIADCVMAIHLVVDGGDQYWLEPETPDVPALTDEAKLQAAYPGILVRRDTALFNAALISVGRFGAIYSVVIKALPQYNLNEERYLDTWQNIRRQIADPRSPLYTAQRSLEDPFNPQHFLQIAVCLAPLNNGQRNQVGITRRWTVPTGANPPGRKERVGEIVPFPFPSEEPIFTMVGNSHPYSPDSHDPTVAASISMLEAACGSSNFICKAVDRVIEDIEQHLGTGGTAVAASIAAVAAIGSNTLILLTPQLLALLSVLKDLLERVLRDIRFSEALEAVRHALLETNPDPNWRAAGVFLWRMVYNQTFATQQRPWNYEAISYAVLDKYHYGNRCEVNIDSIEVFFDATQNNLVTFVDELIAFEIAQEFEGRSLVGYISLRFTKPSRASIGPSRFKRTCVVEVACLKDVNGGQQLLDFAVGLARRPYINGIFHWGQRNECTREDIDRLFPPLGGKGGIAEWRKALGVFTREGQRNAFSNAFTRQTGLEL